MRSEDKLISTNFSLNVKGRLRTYNQPVIMGILNATPDSFYDGGKYQNRKALAQQAGKMLEEGAEIIDIGGYSSRPGAQDIPEEEELNRIIPALETIREHFPEAIISIDTFRSGVARKALDQGADIINDISSWDDDPEMLELIAERRVPYIIMHKKGRPGDMQSNPHYQDVNKEILKYFSEKIETLHQRGVSDIIIDPGFGFGKSNVHNYEILKNLNLYKTFELPVLAGMSRKSMINKVIGTTPEEALNGTTVLNTFALIEGCDILRVHDVKEAVQTIKICSYYDQPV